MFRPLVTFLKVTAAYFDSLLLVINVDFLATIRLLSSWLTAGFIVVDKLILVNSAHLNFQENSMLSHFLDPQPSTRGPDSRTTP